MAYLHPGDRGYAHRSLCMWERENLWTKIKRNVVYTFPASLTFPVDVWGKLPGCCSATPWSINTATGNCVTRHYWLKMSECVSAFTLSTGLSIDLIDSSTCTRDTVGKVEPDVSGPWPCPCIPTHVPVFPLPLSRLCFSIEKKVLVLTGSLSTVACTTFWSLVFVLRMLVDASRRVRAQVCVCLTSLWVAPWGQSLGWNVSVFLYCSLSRCLTVLSLLPRVSFPHL